MAEEARVSSCEKYADESDAGQQPKHVQRYEYARADIGFFNGLLYQGIPTAAEGSFQGNLGLCLIQAQIVG